MRRMRESVAVIWNFSSVNQMCPLKITALILILWSIGKTIHCLSATRILAIFINPIRLFLTVHCWLANGKTGFNWYGPNYYSKAVTEKVFQKLNKELDDEYENLILWLEKAADKDNGFYILGI